MITNNFARYFSGIYAPNNDQRAVVLYNEYLSRRENYFGYPFPHDSTFDTELVSKVMLDLNCGKAPDVNERTAEHLLRSHPILPVVLSKLIQLILSGFGYGFTVPLQKSNNCIVLFRNLVNSYPPIINNSISKRDVLQSRNLS